VARRIAAVRSAAIASRGNRDLKGTAQRRRLERPVIATFFAGRAAS
jgi:hypothetical protein